MSDKIIGQILETKDYNKFTFQQFNRDIDKFNMKNLEKAIKTKGNLIPIIVRKENSKLRIVEGHHRFLVLKKLGLPIAYEFTINNNIGDEEMLLSLNNTGKKWSCINFLKFRAISKNDAAAKLILSEPLHFKKITGVTIKPSVVMALMLGHTGTTWAKDLKQTVSTQDFNTYCSTLRDKYADLLKSHKIFKGTRSAAAMHNILKNKNYDHAYFVNLCNSGEAARAFKVMPTNLSDTEDLFTIFYNSHVAKTKGKVQKI